MKDGRDHSYAQLLEAADDEHTPEPMDAEDPLYILYTSGSTAKPKGILHTTGGYLTGVAYTHAAVFDLKPEEDVYWCAADVGWVTGHSYIIYGPLANGTTSVMWEGAPDYPAKDIWWEIVERYKVTIMYCAPTAIRACMKWGAEHPEKHDLSSLRLLGTVGEPINPKAWLWYHLVVGGGKAPIVDTWWQTETGSIMITTLPGLLDTKPGSAGKPLPGIEAAVVDEEGKDVDEGQGYLILKRPWPAMLRTLYKEDDRFIETYFAKYGKDTYLVGDAARKDEDGYFWIIGRIDDVVNVSGHRLSTAEVESAIVSHPKVAEAAVIGQADEDTGQAITAFVTLEGAEDEGTDALIDEIRERVASRIGKFARPKRIIWAGDLPKTRSGKIMRRLLRDIAEGRELGDVTTLRDPDVMAQLEGKIKERGTQRARANRHDEPATLAPGEGERAAVDLGDAGDEREPQAVPVAAASARSRAGTAPPAAPDAGSPGRRSRPAASPTEVDDAGLAGAVLGGVADEVLDQLREQVRIPVHDRGRELAVHSGVTHELGEVDRLERRRSPRSRRPAAATPRSARSRGRSVTCSRRSSSESSSARATSSIVAVTVERGAQLVRRVGREPLLAGERVVEAARACGRSCRRAP